MLIWFFSSPYWQSSRIQVLKVCVLWSIQYGPWGIKRRDNQFGKDTEERWDIPSIHLSALFVYVASTSLIVFTFLKVSNIKDNCLFLSCLSFCFSLSTYMYVFNRIYLSEKYQISKIYLFVWLSLSLFLVLSTTITL